MLFCPSCANMLLVKTDTGAQEFTCQTCPYHYFVNRPMIFRERLKRKEVDDVLGGADAWKNVDSTEASCPKCEHDRAYYMMIQIRSADEPASIFYKCCKPECGYQWKEK